MSVKLGGVYIRLGKGMVVSHYLRPLKEVIFCSVVKYATTNSSTLIQETGFLTLYDSDLFLR